MRTYKQVVKLLKSCLPADIPVRVRRLRMPKHLDGDCRRKDEWYLIRIDRELPEHEAIETLLHEWAHTLSWGGGNDHRREWGIAYATVYRLFLREFLEKAG